MGRAPCLVQEVVDQAQQAVLLRVEQRLERLLVAQLVPAETSDQLWLVTQWYQQEQATAGVKSVESRHRYKSCSPFVDDTLLAIIAALVVCRRVQVTQLLALLLQGCLAGNHSSHVNRKIHMTTSDGLAMPYQSHDAQGMRAEIT